METKEILKYVFVIGSLPIVLPFLKSLVKDLIRAFEEDGGLLGQPPSAGKLEEIRRKRRGEPSPLVSEPLAHVRKAARGKGDAPAKQGGGPRSSR